MRNPKTTYKVKRVEGATEPEGEDGGETTEEEDIGMEQWDRNTPVFVTVEIEERPIKMKLDTGAAVSLLPHSTYQRQFSHCL